jgi:Flp pilus assembly protein TadG
MMNRCNKRRSRGIATIEAAITLPLLLLLMIAAVEVGRVFVQYTTLANAVRNAARHAAGEALLGTTQTVFISPALRTATKNLAVYGNTAGSGNPRLPRLSAAQITVSDAGANNVLVSAVYPYQGMFGPSLPEVVSSGTIDTAFNLQIDVTMRAL